MLLDFGAAVSVVISFSIFNNYILSLTCAASTPNGKCLSMSGQGVLGQLSNVLISDTIRYNFISISQLSDIGITFTPSGVTVAIGVAFVCGRCH